MTDGYDDAQLRAIRESYRHGATWCEAVHPQPIKGRDNNCVYGDHTHQGPHVTFDKREWTTPTVARVAPPENHRDTQATPSGFQ